MELRLAQLEHNNRGKQPEMRPNECVFDSHNGRIVMEYVPAHNQRFVAYATPKTIAENVDFICLR